MNKLATALLAALAFVAPAAAQQRQPAQITTTPPATTTNPQPFELLDKTGTWVPLGVVDPRNHTLNAVWSDSYLASAGSDCGAVKAAYAALNVTGGVINLPNRVMAMGSDCQIQINGAPVRFVGQGWSESQNLGDASGRPRTGTWFDVSDTTKSLFYITTYAANGVTFENLAFYEGDSMPPVVNDPWTPTTFPPVIYANNSANVRVNRVYCLAVYDCFKGYSNGRIQIDSLYGESFHSMVDLDLNADTVWLDNVHNWGFWSGAATVQKWLNQNSDTLRFGRVDGPMVNRVFGINQHALLHQVNSGQGVISRGFFSQLYADGSFSAVLIDANAGSGAYHFGFIDHQGNDNSQGSGTHSIPNGGAIIANAPSNFQIDQLRDQLSGGSVIQAGTGPQVYAIGSLFADQWGANYTNSSPLR